jgi:hypothetical protein
MASSSPVYSTPPAAYDRIEGPDFHSVASLIARADSASRSQRQLWGKDHGRESKLQFSLESFLLAHFGPN